MNSFVFDNKVDPDREAVIEGRLLSFNEQHAALWTQNHDGSSEALPLHVYVHDRSHRLVGGVVARTHAIRSWLEILVLWIDEDFRGLGLGRKLMEEAEEEARRRGCKYARLASSDYQAPQFYESIGYISYGRLENCPPGDTAYYYWKSLVE
jgi:ribosomal protein S18 acetylase RimI-like enzyme